jgi:hypothetical protein
VVDAARSKAPLGDLKAAALAEDAILEGNLLGKGKRQGEGERKGERNGGGGRRRRKRTA